MGRSSAVRLLQVLVVAAIFYFLGDQIVRNWAAVAAHRWSLKPVWLAAAGTLILLCLAGDIAIWQLTVRCLGARMGFRQATITYIPSLIARYVPGKVASLVARVWLSERAGVSAYRALGAAMLEVALRTMAALVVFALSLPAWASLEKVRWTWPALIVVPIVLIILHPRILQPLLKLALKVLKRPPVVLPFAFPQVLGLFGLLCLRWAAYGIGLYCLVNALTPELLSHAGALIGMAALSWAIGFLSMIAPAGLGVNEGALALFLRQFVAAGVGSVIAVLARVWLLCGELVWLVVAALLRRVRRAAA